MAVKKEVPLEKRVYDNLRKHIDNRIDLLKREFKAAIGEKGEKFEDRVGEVEDEFTEGLETLEAKMTGFKSLLNGIKVEVEDLNKKANTRPVITRKYTYQQQQNFNRIQEAANKGSKSARVVMEEERYIPEPHRHMHKWDSKEDEQLESNLIHLVELAAIFHKRKKSAIMFRIFKLLTEAGIKI